MHRVDALPRVRESRQDVEHAGAGGRSTLRPQPGRDRVPEVAATVNCFRLAFALKCQRHVADTSTRTLNEEGRQIFFKIPFQRSHAALRALRFASMPAGSSPARMKPWPAPS